MLPHRVATLAFVFLAAGASSATAQVFGAQPSRPAVCDTFNPLQMEAQQGMGALKTANEKKAPREEFCQIFIKLSGTMAKVSKFLETNKTTCNIPTEAVGRARADYLKVVGYRKSACSTAPGPAAPSLSDVLGAPVLTDSNTNKPESNIFNTLTGNPLTR